MKRLLLACAAGVSLVLLGASPASAAFGLNELELNISGADGSPAMQAGAHPAGVVTNFGVDTEPAPTFALPSGSIKNLDIEVPPGLIGDPNVVPRCSDDDFAVHPPVHPSQCPANTQLGTSIVAYEQPGHTDRYPVYSITPPPGAVMKLGLHVSAVSVPVAIVLRVSEKAPYEVVASLENTSNVVPVYGAQTTLWGVPAAPIHDAERSGPGCNSGCSINMEEKPFLTVPVACDGPLQTTFRGDAWEEPGPPFFEKTVLTHDTAAPPNPLGMTGCERLSFLPAIASQPTTRAASSPSGLDFSIDFKDEGLTNPAGLAQSDIKKAVVTLPQGMSVNPSIAEGLETCSVAGFEAERSHSEPGEGCPQASKVGEVEVETPLLKGELLKGSIYVASQYDNLVHSRYALYMVIKDPGLGILVKLPGKLEPDDRTGQLVTTFGEAPYEIPQFPFSQFRFHFRPGARSPLATPPTCGSYQVNARMFPWSGAAPLTSTSTFQVSSGPDGAPCPTGGLPPFKPGLIAGSINNAAGRFSPFNVRLFRTDSEQEITHFSIKLPPGLTGKLAGIPYCSDAAIAAAKAREGTPHGGAEEIASPSCSAASLIGRTLVGSGVGPALAYAPGKLYLAGPYNGAPISIAAITAAKVGPFDLGTVVVREALKVNPETAEVFVDATGSDPIPHIIQGIPVHLRDIRAYVDRSNFALNPTDCDRTSTASTVLGSGLDFASEADDVPVTVSTPYQAADCAALPFDPKLSLRLIGGTKRAAHPAFRATLKMNGIGEAAIGRAQVTLPHSEFLENAHIKTICTRAQFRAQQCPAGSIYGRAKAITPLLDAPLEGPVYLRSSEHPLPDLVAHLAGSQITVDLVGRIDSVGGGIRNTFEVVPDAPVKSFTLEMQGAKKGLLVNSTDLCKGIHRALVDFEAHNGKEKVFRPKLQAQCKKAAKANRAKKAKWSQRTGFGALRAAW
jgi:hypothetical protein